MKKISVILILLAVTGITFGQDFNKMINHPLRVPFDSAKLAYTYGNYQKAILLYTTVITKTDTSAFETAMRKSAFIYRSFCKKELKDFTGSIADMDQAILIDPNDLASYIDRGTTYIAMDDLKKASEDFLRIVQKDSTSEQAHGAYYNLGQISKQESRTAEGIEYLTKALKIEPNDIEILYLRGYYYGLTMNSESAIKDYDKIIKLDPSATEIYANRGAEKINLYNRQGKQDAKLLSSACKDLKKAKERGDNTVDDLLFIYCK